MIPSKAITERFLSQMAIVRSRMTTAKTWLESTNQRAEGDLLTLNRDHNSQSGPDVHVINSYAELWFVISLASLTYIDAHTESPAALSSVSKYKSLRYRTIDTPIEYLQYIYKTDWKNGGYLMMKKRIFPEVHFAFQIKSTWPLIPLRKGKESYRRRSYTSLKVTNVLVWW